MYVIGKKKQDRVFCEVTERGSVGPRGANWEQTGGKKNKYVTCRSLHNCTTNCAHLCGQLVCAEYRYSSDIRLFRSPLPILSPPSFPGEPSSSSKSQASLPLSDMSDQLGSPHFQVLFEAALQNYERQTGITLSMHPLAEQLQNCDSVESVTAVLRDQTQAFSEFRRNDKVLKPLKKAVSVLYKLSSIANFGQDVVPVRSSPTRCSLFNVPSPSPHSISRP